MKSNSQNLPLENNQNQISLDYESIKQDLFNDYTLHQKFIEKSLDSIKAIKIQEKRLSILKNLIQAIDDLGFPFVLLMNYPKIENSIFALALNSNYTETIHKLLQKATKSFELDGCESVPIIKDMAIQFGIPIPKKPESSLNQFEGLYLKIKNMILNCREFRSKLQAKEKRGEEYNQEDEKIASNVCQEIQQIQKEIEKMDSSYKNCDREFLKNLVGSLVKVANYLDETFSKMRFYQDFPKQDDEKNDNSLSDMLVMAVNENLNQYQNMVIENPIQQQPQQYDYPQSEYPTLVSLLQKIPGESKFAIPMNSDPYNEPHKIKNNETMNIENDNHKIINIHDPKLRTKFQLNEIIQVDEDSNIEFKMYFYPFHSKAVFNIKKAICAFLNSTGGRLYLGITDDKVVQGLKLTSKERDTLKLCIQNSILSNFYPESRNLVQVVFVPVLDEKGNDYVKNLYVVKIIIRQGDPKHLYSCEKNSYTSFKRFDGMSVNLDARLILDEIINRGKDPLSSTNYKSLDDFQDPPPEKILDTMEDCYLHKKPVRYY